MWVKQLIKISVSSCHPVQIHVSALLKGINQLRLYGERCRGLYPYRHVCGYGRITALPLLGLRGISLYVGSVSLSSFTYRGRFEPLRQLEGEKEH